MEASLEGSTNKDVATIEVAEPTINVYDFQDSVNDNLIVKYQVLKLSGSVLIWIGTMNNGTFGDLSLAMKSPYDSLPVTSKILGALKDTPSVSLASRLTKKLNKPVYVSFNIPVDRFVLGDIEKRLLEEIKNVPDVF